MATNLLISHVYAQTDSAILDTKLDKNFGHQATKLKKLRNEALGKETFAKKCTTQTCHVSTVTPNVPSHVVRCKSKKTVPSIGGEKIYDQRSSNKPLIPQSKDHGFLNNAKYYRNNMKGGQNKIVTIGNRLKKILRKIPPEIGTGEPPVAVAENPGKIPEKRGAIFSYAARDLHYQRRNAIAITKIAKAENWYTEAKDYVSAKSSGITPTWE